MVKWVRRNLFMKYQKLKFAYLILYPLFLGILIGVSFFKPKIFFLLFVSWFFAGYHGYLAAKFRKIIFGEKK